MRVWEKGRMWSLSAVADRKGVGGGEGVSLTIKKFFLYDLKPSLRIP